jgi:hypothetical protein
MFNPIPPPLPWQIFHDLKKQCERLENFTNLTNLRPSSDTYRSYKLSFKFHDFVGKTCNGIIAGTQELK